MATLFTKNQDMDTDTAQQMQSTYANAKDTAQDILVHARENAQSTFKTTRKATQDTLAKVQKNTKVGLNKVQDLLITVMGIIAAFFYKNQSKGQKKIKQAQVSLQKTATPMLEKTQDIVVTSTKKASKSLQKAANKAKDVKESLQDQYAHHQQKRRRNRALFRIGLVAGVALALFYTPITGSNTRQSIVHQWQQFRSYFER